MMLRSISRLAVLLAIALAPVVAPGLAAQTTDTSRQDTTKSISGSNTANPGSQPAGSLQDLDNKLRDSGSNGYSSQNPQPHITLSSPPPSPQPWRWQDQVAWASNLVLTFLAYCGIMLAWTTLKKIERQTGYAEATAQAALESANAALLNAQAMIDAERPWVLITVEPSRKSPNNFNITAINRGRTPARIIATSDRIGIAIDESYLPAQPEYAKPEPTILSTPIILLSGESAIIQPFGRDDVKWVCKSEESHRRVELGQDKIFLYGKVIYKDLIAPSDKQTHETDWCCRYVHGEKASDLVISGPHGYVKHS